MARQRGRAVVFAAIHQQTVGGQAADELGEDPLDVLEVQVVAVMVQLHVGEHRHLGVQQKERPVGLVGLAHHEVALAVPGVGAEVVQLASDQEGRVETAVDQ